METRVNAAADDHVESTGGRRMKQLPLPLHSDPAADSALRKAWLASRLRMPFHVAVNIPAVAICLRHMAAAENRRRGCIDR